MKFTRTLIKSISWRVIAVLITSTIVFLLTGSWILTGSIAGFDAALKIGVYMIHEWLWERKRNDNTNKSD